MLDIKFIREHVDAVKKAAIDKGVKVDVDQLIKLDAERRQLITELEGLRAERNAHAESMKGGKPSPEAIAKGKVLKQSIAALEASFETVDKPYWPLLKQVPNMPLDDVPVGLSEDDNALVYEWGDKPTFDFEPLNHWQLAEAKGWIDKERAAKVAGARFVYIKGPLVELQFALMQWVLKTLGNADTLASIAESFDVEVSDKPFLPVLPPFMLRTGVYDAMDRLEPSEDRYKIEGEELWLQGSAEHVLGSMHMNETLNEADLPLRYLGYATSFRKEAGSYGKDMEGIIRLHQFDKLEMQIIATPEQAMNEHLFTIAIQEHLLRSLNIPYRKLLKCTYDIGKPNARGVDMDAWLPGQDGYKETHTADYMTDYQARRLKTRVKRTDGSNDLIHTIDATALAMRIMVAIIENYQTADGGMRVPDVLQVFIGRKQL